MSRSPNREMVINMSKQASYKRNEYRAHTMKEREGGKRGDGK